MYENKKITGSELCGLIQPGQRIVLGHCVAEPTYLVKQLVAYKEHYKNVEILQMLPLGDMPLAGKDMESHFHYKFLFAGKSTKNAISEGRAEYIPCFFREFLDCFRKSYLLMSQ